MRFKNSLLNEVTQQVDKAFWLVTGWRRFTEPNISRDQLAEFKQLAK
jgi:hypothetical protein